MANEVVWDTALECGNECLACLWQSCGKEYPELTAAFSKLRPVPATDLCMKCGQPFGSRAAYDAAGKWLAELRKNRPQTRGRKGRAR